MTWECSSEEHPGTLGWMFLWVPLVQATFLDVTPHRWRHELADLLSCSQAGTDGGRRYMAIFVRQGQMMDVIRVLADDGYIR
jgi:hypothetical protein